jgi:S-layer protein
MAATDYTDVAQQLYISYFGRPADTYGLASYTAQLAAANAPTNLNDLNTAVQADPNGALAKLVQSFNSSTESINLYGSGNDILSISKFVNAVYNNVLHRDADNEGGQFWINEIVSGRLSKANAALAITQGALANTSTQGLIDAQVVKNTLAVAEDFTTSLDTLPKVNAYAGDAAAAAARGLLTGVTSTTTVAGYHSNVTGVIITLTAPPVVNVTLTAGVDTLVGGAGNDVFQAGSAVGDASTTFSALDSIDGGAGNNTLIISDAAGTLGGAVVPGVVVKNVQNVTINTAAGVGTAVTAYDVTGFSGLTNFTASATGAVNVKVAETTAATITNAGAAGATAAVTVTGGSSANVTTGAGAVVIAGNAGGLTSATVVGGTTVDVQTNAAGTAVDKLTSVSLKGNTGVATIQSDALTSLSLNATSANVTVSAAAATRALGVTLNGVTGGTISDATATTVSVTSTGTASTGATLAAAAATSVTLGGDKALTLTSLNAALATSLTVNDAALTTISAFGTTNKLATVTVTGAGGLNANLSTQTVLTTVDASASSGANTVTLGASTIYKGGSGVDTVTLTVAPTVAVDGGAGTNDVLIINAAADFAHAKATGFETLGLGTATTGSYDATGFSHLSVANAVTGPVTFGNVAAGTDLSLSAAAGSAVTYSLANSTGITDVLNLKLSAGTAFANSVVAAGIETVNIALTDTNTTAGHAAFSETLTLSASAATKIAVTGNGTFGLTLIDTDTALTTVDASGLTVAGTGATGTGFVWTSGALTSAATIKGSVNGGDTINAAAATKALTITVNGGTNVITGGGDIDTITAGNGTNTISSGAGNDIITVGSGANTITGGAGADLITLAAHAGKVDTIVQTATASGANIATTNQTSVLTTSLDVVKGIAVGDKLDLSAFASYNTDTTTLVFNAANLAAADNKISFASGTYDASGVFTYSANGADTLVTYDTDATGTVAGQSIVLVGYHASATATAVGATGIITLG